MIAESRLFQSKFIPAKILSDKLMIVLHGKGDSLEPFLNFDDEIAVPELNYLLVNAPQKFMGGFSWYKEAPKMKNEVLEVRERMLQLMDEVVRQGWKPENIFLFGFSQGCLISADLALNFPYKLAGVIGVSGYFHFFPRWRNNQTVAARQTPWLFTHGFRDTLLPIKVTKFGIKKLRDAGCPVEMVEMNKGHVLKDSEYPMMRKWIKEKLTQAPSPSAETRAQVNSLDVFAMGFDVTKNL
jgi:phospholipase/carboxylesterase